MRSGEPDQNDRLPDLLRPGLKVVFVGTSAGTCSATIGHYYAGTGNRFWRVLFEVGLTPHKLEPSKYRELYELDIGLTDIAKTSFGMDHHIAHYQYDPARFANAIAMHKPLTVAFNGKKAASVALGLRCKKLVYGCQPEPFARTAKAFVLPSTSGAAIRYWDERYWRELAEFIHRRS